MSGWSGLTFSCWILCRFLLARFIRRLSRFCFLLPFFFGCRRWGHCWGYCWGYCWKWLWNWVYYYVWPWQRFLGIDDDYWVNVVIDVWIGRQLLGVGDHVLVDFTTMSALGVDHFVYFTITNSRPLWTKRGLIKQFLFGFYKTKCYLSDLSINLHHKCLSGVWAFYIFVIFGFSSKKLYIIYLVGRKFYLRGLFLLVKLTEVTTILSEILSQIMNNVYIVKTRSFRHTELYLMSFDF